MPQGQHLAVDRVHGVERRLEADLPLGTDGRLARAGQVPQQLGGQGGGGRPGQRPLVERDLPPRVPHLGPEVVPVQVAQLVPGDRAEPEEERDVGLLDIGAEVLPGLEADILDDVGGVDPTLEPRVQPEAHHPAQPRPVPLHAAPPSSRGRRRRPVSPVPRHRLIGRHGDHHTILIVARAGLVTGNCEKRGGLLGSVSILRHSKYNPTPIIPLPPAPTAPVPEAPSRSSPSRPGWPRRSTCRRG